MRIAYTIEIICMMLVAMPSSASDLLEVFGNANMDNTINEKDVAYVEGVIKGKNAATNLSDANYDGKIK
jgi:iron complex transport system substrate-binding protein